MKLKDIFAGHSDPPEPPQVFFMPRPDKEYCSMYSLLDLAAKSKVRGDIEAEKCTLSALISYIQKSKINKPKHDS